ncbi:hypothetical protein QQ045_013432 [Rhodiola kirilowii]
MGFFKMLLNSSTPKECRFMLFHCKWFNTDPVDGNMKMDHRLLSIDTSNTWYDDAPYCLAKHAQKLFYLEDQKLGDNWKVVNVVTQRGTYSHYCDRAIHISKVRVSVSFHSSYTLKPLSFLSSYTLSPLSLLSSPSFKPPICILRSVLFPM